MVEPPRSEMFDDVYFSALGGLEETRHVFINGNNLPKRWQNTDRFTICETGFGTGLNFLTAWTLFEETAPQDAVLDYISFEKYPLSVDQITQALKPWAHVFGDRLKHLCAEYPLRAPGFHRIVLSPRIILTLIFDDVNEALPELEASVDCWFLDGFTPAKNPDMWSETLFEYMHKLSAPSASFATFTAAGFVKRGLESAGFEVRKEKGFAHKREMLCGTFTGQGCPKSKPCKTVSIIGGGLAGTSAAHVFQSYGVQPVLYERAFSLAAGASGNQTGLYNPRITALRDPVSHFYVPAFVQALKTFSKFEDVSFRSSGALHLVTTEDKRTRFTKTVHNWAWPDDQLSLLSADQASDVAGIQIEHEALYLKKSGSVSPHQLCKSYTRNCDVRFETSLSPDQIETDALLFANGTAIIESLSTTLPLKKVRGQVTYAPANDVTSNLKTALCYGGYIVPAINGMHVIGSTFQRWLDHAALLAEDDEMNLDKLYSSVPVINGLKAQTSWAGVRVTSPDHMPVIGAVSNGIYVSTAHGSHGILSSLMGAHILADLLRGGPVCVPRATLKALDPNRFKKGEE